MQQVEKNQLKTVSSEDFLYCFDELNYVFVRVWLFSGTVLKKIKIVILLT